MNHKEKTGYIILGAVIMLIGMSINNLTSFPVTAQNNGEIMVQKLTFVDETGEPLFRLQAEVGTRAEPLFHTRYANTGTGANDTLVFFNRRGQRVVSLTSSMLKNHLSIRDITGMERVALSATEDTGRVKVWEWGKGGASMRSDGRGASVGIWFGAGGQASMSTTERGTEVGVWANIIKQTPYGSTNSARLYARMGTTEYGGRVRVFGKEGDRAVSMSTTEHGGRVDVFNKQGKNRAVMSVNEYGNGVFSSWDKNGYRQ